jgi:hypothetical protein
MSSDSTYASTHQPPDVTDATRGEVPKVTVRKLFKEYARENPDIVAAFCFGIGFVLGWKLKPW